MKGALPTAAVSTAAASRPRPRVLSSSRGRADAPLSARWRDSARASPSSCRPGPSRRWRWPPRWPRRRPRRPRWPSPACCSCRPSPERRSRGSARCSPRCSPRCSSRGSPRCPPRCSPRCSLRCSRAPAPPRWPPRRRRPRRDDEPRSPSAGCARAPSCSGFFLNRRDKVESSPLPGNLPLVDISVTAASSAASCGRGAARIGRGSLAATSW